MALMRDADTLVLPEGARLLHIGPHKTGTTSLQGALWSAREALRAQGVRHAGSTRNPSNAVRAVVGQPSPYSDTEPPPISHWHALVRELRSAREPRVIVSSEFFAWAKPDAIRRIVEDLDPARVHVAVTLRPLARIIPSMWQQNIQAGQTVRFERWLKGVLKPLADRPNPGFWMLHHHDQLIARWADAVGSDRVTAVVVDERDPALLLRTFERLLDLREGTLAVMRDYTNRSLTLPETEAVRAFNIAFKAEALPRAVHARLMRFGAAQEMKRRQPAADEARVELPDWADDRVATIAAEIVAAIEASGVRVIGDIGALVEPAARQAESGTSEQIAIPPEVAASMAMGMLVASGNARRPTSGSPRFGFVEPIELARIPTPQVAATVVQRAWQSVVRRMNRFRALILRG